MSLVNTNAGTAEDAARVAQLVEIGYRGNFEAIPWEALDQVRGGLTREQVAAIYRPQAGAQLYLPSTADLRIPSGLGGLIGGAIGSVVPGIGTALGAGLGSFLAGATGGNGPPISTSGAAPGGGVLGGLIGGAIPGIGALIPGLVSGGTTSTPGNGKAPLATFFGGQCPPGRVLRRKGMARDVCIKKPRMNVFNPRALARADRRVTSFARRSKAILQDLGYKVSSRKKSVGPKKRKR